ncbi:MAG: hypothetical protein C4290_02465, partial [Chloroflexota bacterium]
MESATLSWEHAGEEAYSARHRCHRVNCQRQEHGLSGDSRAGRCALQRRTLVHQLYAPGTPGFARVVAELGPEVIGPDGRIDRRVLGSEVFSNPEAMRRLTRRGRHYRPNPSHVRGVARDVARAPTGRDGGGQPDLAGLRGAVRSSLAGDLQPRDDPRGSRRA